MLRSNVLDLLGFDTLKGCSGDGETARSNVLDLLGFDTLKGCSGDGETARLRRGEVWGRIRFFREKFTSTDRFLVN